MTTGGINFRPPAGRGGPQFIPRPEGARLGPAASWADVGAVPPLDDVVASIQAFEPFRPADDSVDGKPPSAVLVPIVETDSGLELLLTRRSWNMRNHPGQISFPGGRMDPEDGDLVVTALRETEEEVGIDRGLVRILGELDRLTTVSSPAYIAPYVGLIKDRPNLTVSEVEVDGVLHVPIAELLDPAIYRQEIWTIGGRTASITFFELEDDTLWGATARMVRNFLEMITGTETHDPHSGIGPTGIGPATSD